MERYSPLHNADKNPNPFPSLLLVTGDHDDRVVPLHSLKLIATLQATVGQRANQHNPLLIHVDTKSGHGAGKPTSKVIEESSMIYAFIASRIGAAWRD